MIVGIAHICVVFLLQSRVIIAKEVWFFGRTQPLIERFLCYNLVRIIIFYDIFTENVPTFWHWVGQNAFSFPLYPRFPDILVGE
jgi:hypothetical protein